MEGSTKKTQASKAPKAANAPKTVSATKPRSGGVTKKKAAKGKGKDKSKTKTKRTDIPTTKIRELMKLGGVRSFKLGKDLLLYKEIRSLIADEMKIIAGPLPAMLELKSRNNKPAKVVTTKMMRYVIKQATGDDIKGDPFENLKRKARKPASPVANPQ
jgi:hypothetical protein